MYDRFTLQRYEIYSKKDHFAFDFFHKDSKINKSAGEMSGFQCF